MDADFMSVCLCRCMLTGCRTIQVSADCVSVQMHADKPKDPNAPKPNKTPFNFFSVDARQKAKESYPDLTQAEITKRVSFND